MSLAEVFGKPTSYYRPGQLTRCVDCGCLTDAEANEGPDHGGSCLTTRSVGTPNNALGIILRAAKTQPRLSADDVRAVMDQAGVSPNSRGGAWALAVKHEWLQEDGWIKSAAPRTKGHKITVYKSLRYQGAAA